ncbi:MAG TPA: histidine phosphatase family protein [Prolixibacteraceae bacterium]|nr:histidine phosphatase family protein [Prolixibacteraceae bacterium]
MKRVIMVRHAKTISYGYDQDYDRTLTERGQNDAERISHEMVKTGIIPDLIISSPAVRTTQTTRIFAGNSGYPSGDVRYDKKIYSGMTTSSFIHMLRELEDHHTTVMVVGHNPTMYYFIDYLLPGFSLDVPTCSTIVIEFDIGKWADLKDHSGKMTHRWIPDLL